MVRKVPELPEAYTNMRSAYLSKKLSLPSVGRLSIPAPDALRRHIKQEYKWLEKICVTETVKDALNITWSFHHVQQKIGQRFDVSLSSLFPLFPEQAHSVAAIKHTMEKIKEPVGFLNPGQTPVIVVGQLLYTLGKKIQWQ